MLKNKKIIVSCMLLIILLVSGCDKSREIPESNNRQVVDMAGRTVEIPKEIKKVYSTGPIGTIFLYTLAPKKLSGWNNDLRDVEKRYINEEYHQLPVLGTWRGAKYNGNIEELLKVKPDLIINMGDLDASYIADTDTIQEQLGIPVLMIDGSIDNAAEAYRYLGKVLDLEDRAEQLAKYCIQTMTDVSDKLGNIPADEKVRLYYAEGTKGLETEAKGSLNAEILELAGAVNVADPGVDQNVRRMQVSFEQLLKWDPDVIILSTDGDRKGQLYNSITREGVWNNIKAVKNKQIYEIPNAPYDWINRPPSVNRLIGIKWLANLLYPETYKVDMKKEIREFFNLFYQYNLSQTEVEEILQRSVRK